MAALCEPGKPFALYVPGAEGGEAALFRRDSAQCRRVSAISPRLRAARREATVGQSGLAHPFGPSAEAGNAGPVLDAVEPRHRFQREKRRCARGIHRALWAGCHARDASETASARRIRDPLFSRFRAAGKKIPRADGCGTRGPRRFARCALAIARRYAARENSGCGLRGRAPGAVSRQNGQGQIQGREARRRTRLVQHALSGAARPGEGPALRLLCRGLWAAKHGRYDRRRARALAERGPSAQIKSARALAERGTSRTRALIKRLLDGYWLDQTMRAIQ